MDFGLTHEPEKESGGPAISGGVNLDPATRIGHRLVLPLPSEEQTAGWRPRLPVQSAAQQPPRGDGSCSDALETSAESGKPSSLPRLAH
jgi:hypothetical protein